MTTTSSFRSTLLTLAIPLASLLWTSGVLLDRLRGQARQVGVERLLTQRRREHQKPERSAAGVDHRSSPRPGCPGLVALPAYASPADAVVNNRGCRHDGRSAVPANNFDASR